MTADTDVAARGLLVDGARALAHEDELEATLRVILDRADTLGAMLFFRTYRGVPEEVTMMRMSDCDCGPNCPCPPTLGSPY